MKRCPAQDLGRDQEKAGEAGVGGRRHHGHTRHHPRLAPHTGRPEVWRLSAAPVSRPSHHRREARNVDGPPSTGGSLLGLCPHCGGPRQSGLYGQRPDGGEHPYASRSPTGARTQEVFDGLHTDHSEPAATLRAYPVRSGDLDAGPGPAGPGGHHLSAIRRQRRPPPHQAAPGEGRRRRRASGTDGGGALQCHPAGHKPLYGQRGVRLRGWRTNSR